MPSVVLNQSAQPDPRFNAMTHGFSGESVVVRPEDRPRYNEINLKFNVDWTPNSETERHFVGEMVAQKFQMQNVQHVINNMLFSKGGEAMLTDDYRLLRRYLNEHRRDFYRAFNSMLSLRRSKERERRLKAKIQVELAARPIMRIPETEFETVKPMATNAETGPTRSTAGNDTSQ